MELNAVLNILLLAALLCRGAWWCLVGQDMELLQLVSPLLLNVSWHASTPRPEQQAESPAQRPAIRASAERHEADLFAAVLPGAGNLGASFASSNGSTLAGEDDQLALSRLALERGNASVFAALLADAASQGVQHQYLHDGFAAPPQALDAQGMAFRDLRSALLLFPARLRGDAVDGTADVLAARIEAALESASTGKVANTNYGEQLLMVLHFLFPDARRPASFAFGAFQHAWHTWQLEVRSESRGTSK